MAPTRRTFLRTLIAAPLAAAGIKLLPAPIVIPTKHIYARIVVLSTPVGPDWVREEFLRGRQWLEFVDDTWRAPYLGIARDAAR